jgi:anti-sigma-K factor RskA
MTERDEQLLSDYVLGEMSGVEAVAFEKRVACEPDLARALGEMEETIARSMLADTPVAEPGEEFRERVLAVGETVAPAEPSKVVKFPGWAATGWAAAASLAIAAGLLGYQWSESAREAANLRMELVEARVPLSETRVELGKLLAERDRLVARIDELNSKRSFDQLRIASLSSQLEKASYGFAVFDPTTDDGVIEVVNLPELDGSKQDYQLWVVDPQYPKPVDGGVFQVGADGRGRLNFHTKQPVDSVAAFAVSLEKKGGVPVAEGPMVLVGALPE